MKKTTIHALCGVMSGMLLLTSGTLRAEVCAELEYEQLKSFSGPDGKQPWAGLLLGQDSKLYGTTYQGGANNHGSVFSMNLDGTGFTTLKSFNLAGTGASPEMDGVIQGPDGTLYGTTRVGGPTNGGSPSSGGVIYKMQTDGTGFTVLKAFGGYTGSYYDTAAGYQSTNADGTLITSGLLLASNGKLYGVAQNGGSKGKGTLFTLNTDGTGFSVLFNFGGGYTDGYQNGATPFGALIEGSDGALYGSTLYRGSDGNHGVVFKINTNGSGYTVLKSFHPRAEGPGAFPDGVTEGADGAIYGRTLAGGPLGKGSIWKMNKDGSGFAIIKALDTTTGYQGRSSKMVQCPDGRFYGVARFGGSSGYGTVYALNPDGSDYTVLMSFDETTNDSGPMGRLVLGPDGGLYGTTSAAYPLAGWGTVYRLACAEPPDADEDGVPDNEDNCPDSDRNDTVVIGECDTGVPNAFIAGGCNIGDFIASFAENAKNHGQYMKSVAALCNTLKEAGVITGKQQGKIVSCAAKSDVGK